LNAKPSASLSTISSISDVNNLLNDTYILNYQSSCGLGEICTDDYYITSAKWQNMSLVDQNLYTFSKNIFTSPNDGLSDWNQSYNAIFALNTILENLASIQASRNEINVAKGQALFFRAYRFHDLVETFALPYNAKTATTDLGIPLRLSSNINDKSTRATIAECYNQVINDTKAASSLLPVKTQFPTQPSKIAAYALLARVYLDISDFPNAKAYADSTLTLNPNLTDYNSLSPGSTTLTNATISNYPLAEDIFHCTLSLSEAPLTSALHWVDSNLYKLYVNNDLRQSLFFRYSTSAGNGYKFKGSYEFKLGANNLFSGLATDEIYLIRAECKARLGDLNGALSDLNMLLTNRYKKGTFIPYNTSNVPDPLSLIITERRKELLFRGLRWTDLRRLNSDPKLMTVITHMINGTIYTLPPNDPRYAMPIPPNEIQLSGIQQNQR